MGKHSYGLSWIDENQLFEVTKDAFAKSIRDSRKRMGYKMPPDPFTLVTQSVLLNAPLDDAEAFEPTRSLNKTISNNVGMWHQHVLGLGNGWVDSGSTGGGIDLRTAPGFVVPNIGKPVFAEVKNRYNTIKSSDEKKLWDQLDLAARSSNAYAYVFQIVPETPNRYDRPWDVSGRKPRQHVRCCDGATAYSMVFGVDDALEQLYEVFPKLLSEVASKVNKIELHEAVELYYISMPK